MRFRSWLAALLTAIAAFFGFGGGPRSAAAAPPRDLRAEHNARVKAAIRDVRVNSRLNRSVIPPFHKVKGKTRAFLRPGYAGHR